MKHVFYLVILLVLILIVFNVLSNLFFTTKEGITNPDTNTTKLILNDMVSDGIAGNADAYASSIKSAAVAIQDKFLINKYRSSYENIILNMDDLINNLMLKTTLTLDAKKPFDTIDNLAKLQQAKVALNSVMKFIDQQ